MLLKFLKISVEVFMKFHKTLICKERERFCKKHKCTVGLKNA